MRVIILFLKTFFIDNKKQLGDGVAEWIATYTGAGSNPAMGGIFLRASHGVRREVPPFPSPPSEHGKTYWCPLKNLPNQNTRVYKSTISYPTNKNKQ